MGDLTTVGQAPSPASDGLAYLYYGETQAPAPMQGGTCNKGGGPR